MALTQISTDGIKNGTITGSDLATNVDLVDDQKLRLGTSNALQIFHQSSGSLNQIQGASGVNTRIRQLGNGGALYLAATNIFFQNHNNNQTFLHAVNNGAVYLNHSGNTKFETTSTGVSVTGVAGIDNSSSTSDVGLRVTNNSTGAFSTSENIEGTTNKKLTPLMLRNGSTSANTETYLGFDAGHTSKAQWNIGVKKTASLSGDFIFNTRTGSQTSAERMRITSSGNVGIKCSNPGSLLELNAAAGTKMGISLGAVGDNITASRYIGICKSADQTDLGVNSGFQGVEFGGPSSANEGYLAFHTHDFGVESGERLRIDKSGNVGIGTSSPLRSLDIVDSSNGSLTEPLMIRNGGTGAGTDVGMIFFNGNGTNSGAGALAKIKAIDVGNFDADLVFETALKSSFSTGGTSERMRITSAGNLLVGNAPNEDTTGNSGPKIITTGDITLDGNRRALVFRSSASSAHQMSGIQWWNENGAGVQCAIHGIRESVLGAPAALAFYTSNDVDTTANNGEGDITEAMRIDSNQRILLGTPPSEDTTGNSGTKVISDGDITIDGDQKAFLFRSTAATAQIQSGVQWWNENGAGVMAKIHCVREAINKAPGALSFFTSDDVDTTSNNGEGNITEQMRITSGGKVRIGDSLTSNAAGKFQVVEESGVDQANDCNAYFETNAVDWNIKTYYNTTGTHYHMAFVEQGTMRGRIQGSDGSDVSYLGGSDYRWKENIVDLSGSEGIEICKKLKPRKFNWIENREETGQINMVDGFIAHEVVEAGVLGAVTGEKDAVNEDGSIDGQMLAYGKMTPVLAAAIKGLISKVEVLEAEVAGLKAA